MKKSIKLSVIFNVLESYEVVRRHILYFRRLPIPEGMEVIFVDDGSSPSIRSYLNDFFKLEDKNITLVETRDFRPWTQGEARNIGASNAKGEYFLFSDVDHIITKEVIHFSLNFSGDKAEFSRRWGVFDPWGNIIEELSVLKDYGLPERLYGRVSKPFNIFLLKREHFKTLGGYEPRYSGRYGGEDVNFANKYRDFLFKKGKAKRSVQGPSMFVYPDPARDVRKVFHSLRRKK